MYASGSTLIIAIQDVVGQPASATHHVDRVCVNDALEVSGNHDAHILERRDSVVMHSRKKRQASVEEV